MHILFFTSDLMFPSRVAGVAQKLGAAFQTVGSEAALIERATANLGSIIILDLASPLVDVAAVVPRLKTLLTPPKAILAFGPHVHQAQLTAAQTAGCDVVLTRGQFNSQMEQILSQLA